jgi:phosphoribosylaminoimidazole-succinocarboxamide synthase
MRKSFSLALNEAAINMPATFTTPDNQRFQAKSMTTKSSPQSASTEVLLTLELTGVKKLKSGKVREMFDLGDALLMVATDRISAFDVIMPNGIPNKGRVLTALSVFWFEHTGHIVANHAITARADEFPKRLQPYRAQLEGRSMVVKKAKPLPVECVVRGYLSGSGWKEYRKSQSVCGIKLPAGLLESSELPEPIFTPSTKAEQGHDENITFEEAAKLVGNELAAKVRDTSLAVYKWARDYARQRGIIIADTKFEFGLIDGKLILIDEVLTPDSSRFWPADQYKPGGAQPSFDKQFVRDYLETLDWNKTPPGPVLPPDVVRKTGEKYTQALRLLTGKSL